VICDLSINTSQRENAEDRAPFRVPQQHFVPFPPSYWGDTLPQNNG